MNNLIKTNLEECGEILEPSYYAYNGDYKWRICRTFDKAYFFRIGNRSVWQKASDFLNRYGVINE